MKPSPLQLDLRRLLCPMPVIRTQDYVATLRPGAQLQLLCTDPGVLHDIPAWCRIHGHRVISTQEQDNLITIVIEKGEAS